MSDDVVRDIHRAMNVANSNTKHNESGSGGVKFPEPTTIKHSFNGGAAIPAPEYRQDSKD